MRLLTIYFLLSVCFLFTRCNPVDHNSTEGKTKQNNIRSVNTQSSTQVHLTHFVLNKANPLARLVRYLLGVVGYTTDKVITVEIPRMNFIHEFAQVLSSAFKWDTEKTYHFLCNADSLNFLGVDTQHLFCIIQPGRYEFFANESLRNVLQELRSINNNFWCSGNRCVKARKLGINPQQVIILGSIVEMESHNEDDKKLIAGVYLNRLHHNMLLQADPTVAYSLGNFHIKRLSFKNLKVQSLYNTYLHKGLPIGPICTPSPTTINDVLNAPATSYLFFVADVDHPGRHVFSSNLEKHLQNARKYQIDLNRHIKK
ncbi:MAG: endolytic transglycosylase MltG [Phycisphaerales bacterium]|nr:endolytic transglycosylase MltG [Phycisphaerales bacterium]